MRVIVPFAPAGPTDVFARLMAQKLSEQLGVQFYVENIAGAGGNIGAGRAAQSPPDGYTILVNGATMSLILRSMRTCLTIPSRISIPSPSRCARLRCSRSIPRCPCRQSANCRADQS